jgi:small-conductance mechanosensitive channel
MSQLWRAGHGWFFAVFLFCAALVISNLVHFVLFRLLRRKQSEATLGKVSPLALGLGLQKHLGKPARAIFIVTCLFFVLPFIPHLSQNAHENVVQALAIAEVLSIGWFAAGTVYVIQNLLLRRYDISAADNVRARRVHTQFQLFRRIIIIGIVVVTIGAALWTFHDERMWKAGTGLLASAGLASLVLATAAKSTASNFLAGLQIALTEPIRIDDVVVVQGEWGRVEEINSTYVVIKIWDLRRLVVPLSYFLENGFQNWTRESADIMGTSFLYVDHTTPVEPLRQELLRICKESKLWDGKVCGLQVTDFKENTMEIRCLMSSTNSGDNFDLRCLVREKMIAYVNANFPTALPRTRLLAPANVGGTNGQAI